jgi:hypothetical protein
MVQAVLELFAAGGNDTISCFNPQQWGYSLFLIPHTLVLSLKIMDDNMRYGLEEYKVSPKEDGG